MRLVKNIQVRDRSNLPTTAPFLLRTIALLDDFAHALNQADAVYLAQIYGSAREVDHGDVKVEDLANKINKKHQVITVENVSPLLDHDNAVLRLYGSRRHPNL